MLNSKG